LEFYFKVRSASCNGLIVWFCFFFPLAFNFQCLHLGLLFNSMTLQKIVNIDGCCSIKNYHHQCTLLIIELEETMNNVYIYEAKEGNLYLFCNLVSIFFCDSICWKSCEIMKQQQNVWQLKICDACCARGNHLSKKGWGFRFVSRQTSFVFLLPFFECSRAFDIKLWFFLHLFPL
jgi:hypothetical protein